MKRYIVLKADKSDGDYMFTSVVGTFETLEQAQECAKNELDCEIEENEIEDEDEIVYTDYHYAKMWQWCGDFYDFIIRIEEVEF